MGLCFYRKGRFYQIIGLFINSTYWNELVNSISHFLGSFSTYLMVFLDVTLLSWPYGLLSVWENEIWDFLWNCAHCLIQRTVYLVCKMFEIIHHCFYGSSQKFQKLGIKCLSFGSNQYIWGISANVNNLFGLIITHSFKNSTWTAVKYEKR